MSTAAVARFEILRRRFRAMLPAANNHSRKRRREIERAACLEQVREMAALELALGVNHHDQDLLDGMRTSVRAHLKSAGARFDQEK
jgi:hypothetical protein